MKLLLFSDVHCDEAKCNAIVQKSQEVDLAICAGDVGLVRKGLEQTVQMLKAISVPTLLVPGNSESYSELKETCADWKNAEVLHGKSTVIENLHFYGVGGGIPVTPFGSWSWDFSEAEASKLLAGFPQNGILIVHSPPRGVLDISFSGDRLGSTAIRETVLAGTPRLVVCGHIHKSCGKQQRLGSSDIINAGPKGMYYTL